MGDHEDGFQTKAQVQVLIAAGLQSYEERVVEPRHKETQKSLTDIQALVQQGLGIMKFCGILGTVIGIAWVLFQIKYAIQGHPFSSTLQ